MRPTKPTRRIQHLIARLYLEENATGGCGYEIENLSRQGTGYGLKMRLLWVRTANVGCHWRTAHARHGNSYHSPRVLRLMEHVRTCTTAFRKPSIP